MKIKALMIPDPITIYEKDSIEKALDVMKINSIRHLPVVSRDKTLKGFVTLADLKIGLIPSMVSEVSLKDLMVKDPIVVMPEDDVEIAAQLIYKHKIGGLPVVQDDKLVGIITESDILRAFIDMMGILAGSSRLDVEIGDSPDELNRVLNIVQSNGGVIINIGMATQSTQKRVYYFRLSSCDTALIQKALKKEGFQIIDVMG
jgi:acetoin utilization protein AcuB